MVEPDITFCIPVAPRHQQLAARAIASVQAQTIPCAILTMLDSEGLGPGVLRNRMLSGVQTEFVAFLDADDWIEMTFAEETLAEYRRIGGKGYIFTDWYDNENKVVEAPCLNGMDGYPLSVPGRRPYCGGTFHAITALVPTLWASGVGGFDEDMSGAEDTDFWLKLCTTMRCGYRLARPLFHYSPGGGRAEQFHHGLAYDATMKALSLKYGGKMGCCGDEIAIANPIGDKQPGDVLAMALWLGNRTEYGRITGRNYPRLSMPKTCWIDKRDAEKRPDLWRIVEQTPIDDPPPITSLEQLAPIVSASLQRTILPAPNYAPPINEPPPPPIITKPDVARVIRLANAATEATSEPIFVFSKTDYPSYADIRKLVELSGYKAITIDKLDAFNRAPYIVVSPVPIGDLNGLRARVICWQLEYAGEYVNNYAGFTGEVWASDKAWADANSAKYVLMGSHPGLEFSYKAGGLLRYDLTMLAYMTPRRQSLKDNLSDLRWPEDYPGHDNGARDNVLQNTKLMLHVHQHDNAPYIAPQRIAIAAAYHMPVISETVIDAGLLSEHIKFAPYAELPKLVRRSLGKSYRKQAEALHQYLCIEKTFRSQVEEGLR